MDRFSYPVIVFHGKQDAICSFKESKKFVENKITPYRRLHLFENGYHELQHDE
jgi:alpha-beta hydrolase superfamily lysophospholipase